MSPDQESPGWRLSTEQFQFLEETLKDAILERVDRRIEEAVAQLREGAVAPGGQPAPAGAPESNRRWLEDELERRQAETEKAVEDRFRYFVRELREERNGGGDASPRRPVDGRPIAWAAGALLVAAVVSLLAVPWQVGRTMERRGAELQELTEDARSAVARVRADADRGDSVATVLEASAAAVRSLAGEEALRARLVEDLTANAGFVSRTRGPQGPPGPPGGPPSGVTYGTGAFNFLNPGAVTVATIGQAADGTGQVRFNDPGGRLAAVVGSAAAGGGFARLYAGSGENAVDLHATADSTALLMDGGRGARAFVGTLGGTQARVQVSNATGDGGVTVRSEGGLGAVIVNGRSVADLAEVFPLSTRDGVVPGTVMAARPDGSLAPSGGAYDRAVVGVVSGAGGLGPGLVLGTRPDGTTDLPVALGGQVYVRVGMEGGAVAVGDMLVASSTPGVAMRGSDPHRAAGAVIGKALEPYAGEPGRTEGLVRMLVTTR